MNSAGFKNQSGITESKRYPVFDAHAFAEDLEMQP